jgi:crossover junction endodeoxyribonuclease RusA
MSITVTIPGSPISVNKLYRGRRFLTKEGERIKNEYRYEAYRQYEGKPFKGPLFVSVLVFYNDKRKHDLDNILKALLDSMTGILWEDDSQIQEIIISKFEGTPMVSICVDRMSRIPVSKKERK